MSEDIGECRATDMLGKTGDTAGKLAQSSEGPEKVHVRFMGTGLQALGWGLLAMLISIPIVTMPWAAVLVCRWFVRSLAFSDGTRASFEGRGVQILGYFLLFTAYMVILGLLLPVVTGEYPDAGVIIILGFVVYMLPVQAFVYLVLTRWFVAGVKLSCGTPLRFAGLYVPLCGWIILWFLSVYTIIGWAWVYVAMLRWMVRNVEGEGHRVFFTGSGWGLLWRTLVSMLASMLIVPIPWMAVWMLRWLMENICIRRAAVEGTPLEAAAV